MSNTCSTYNTEYLISYYYLNTRILLKNHVNSMKIVPWKNNIKINLSNLVIHNIGNIGDKHLKYLSHKHHIAAHSFEGAKV